MLVSVMILTMAVTALLSVSAGSSVSARYAKNKIVANWLAQSSLDYIRNTRDSAYIINQDPESDWWTVWVSTTLGTPSTFIRRTRVAGKICFNTNGCYVNIPNQNDNSMPLGIVACESGGCPPLWIDTNGQYTYNSTNATKSPFTVTITSESTQSPDMVEVIARVTWVEGTQDKSMTQSILLSNWQL